MEAQQYKTKRDDLFSLHLSFSGEGYIFASDSTTFTALDQIGKAFDSIVQQKIRSLFTDLPRALVADEALEKRNAKNSRLFSVI